MRIFYGQSHGKADVPSEAPLEASLEITLEIFHGLDSRTGFLGVMLETPSVLQLTPTKNGSVRIELLDASVPAFDSCFADVAFAESLIRSAAEGKDVFQIARASSHQWNHLDLS